MKLRVRLAERSTTASTEGVPTSHGLRFGPTVQEDPHFVAIGRTPGRHAADVRLDLRLLTASAVEGFEPGAEYLLTLEPVARQ